MTPEELTALLVAITAMFGAIAVVLRIILQITQQMRINIEHIATNARVLNGSSQKVLPPK